MSSVIFHIPQLFLNRIHVVPCVKCRIYGFCMPVPFMFTVVGLNICGLSAWAPCQHGLLSLSLFTAVQRRRRQMRGGQKRGGRQVEDRQRLRSHSTVPALFCRQLRAEQIPLSVCRDLGEVRCECPSNLGTTARWAK